MNGEWDFIVLFHSRNNILEEVRSRLLPRLKKIKTTGNLSNFYISREYPKTYNPNSREEDHLRIGFKKPYSRSIINKTIGDVSKFMNKIESSPEWHEIEDCKAIGTQIAEISNKRLGEVGKIAHILHHFLNSSSYQDGRGISEGINF